jgi:hypothetical protein
MLVSAARYPAPATVIALINATAVIGITAMERAARIVVLLLLLCIVNMMEEFVRIMTRQMIFQK